jgi:hypothetical protein
VLPIADTPGAITPDWLTNALAANGLPDGAQVRDVSLSPIGTGQMCDSVRLALRYVDAGSGPETMIAKLPAADETSRATALSLRSYENEVRFYQQLAADLPIRTPEVYYADIDVETASFILLLEDLAPAEPGDQLLGCTVDQAQIAVDELVRLHAPRWGDDALAELEWLHRDKDQGQQFLLALLPMLWEGFRDRYSAVIDPAVDEAGAMLFAHLDGYLLADTRPWTIVHGDYRLDNLLFDATPGGSPIAVVDWQTVTDGPALSDVAYFLGAGLHAEVRRSVEDGLVGRYHAGLLAAGVTGYDWDRCWTDYRRGTWSGLVMAIAASMLVERTERGDEMFMTMASRHSRHALDLDAGDVIS